MTRTIASTIADEIVKTGVDVVRPIILIELDFPSGFTRLWNGIGNLTFDGDTYNGAADLGTISGVEETEELRATGITMALSGIPSDMLSLALTEEYQGRSAKVWIGFMDASNAIIDAMLIFLGRMDIMTIEEGGTSSMIGLTAENVLITLERPNERRYTPEDQKLQFPNDEGFEFVVDIQEKELVWGRG